jgi:hypothetical protein
VKNFDGKAAKKKGTERESKSPTPPTSSLHSVRVRSHIGLYDLEDQFCLNRVLRVFRSREDSLTPEALKRPLAVTTTTGAQIRKQKRHSLFPPLDVDFTTSRAAKDFVSFVKEDAFVCANESKRFTSLALAMKRLLRSRGRYGGEGARDNLGRPLATKVVMLMKKDRESTNSDTGSGEENEVDDNQIDGSATRLPSYPLYALLLQYLARDRFGRCVGKHTSGKNVSASENWKCQDYVQNLPTLDEQRTKCESTMGEMGGKCEWQPGYVRAFSALKKDGATMHELSFPPSLLLSEEDDERLATWDLLRFLTYLSNVEKFVEFDYLD